MSLALTLIANLLIAAGVMAATLIACATVLALGSRLRFSTGTGPAHPPRLTAETSAVLSRR